MLYTKQGLVICLEVALGFLFELTAILRNIINSVHTWQP